MTFVAVAIGGGALVTAGGAIAGGLISANSAREAQQAQERAMQADRAQQDAATQQARADQQPFAQAGMGGLAGLDAFQQTGVDANSSLRALMGLGTPEEQAAAIAQIENSPQFAALLQQQENAILQNASATGGLRGGNVQGALAQGRSALLSQLIQQQLSGLGGLAGAGQNAASNLAGLGQGAAAGQAATGLQGAGQMGNILQGIGASRAGGILGQGQALNQAAQGLGSAAVGGAGMFAGYNLRSRGL